VKEINIVNTEDRPLTGKRNDRGNDVLTVCGKVRVHRAVDILGPGSLLSSCDGNLELFRMGSSWDGN
jgi:hypothetical protein